MGDGHQLEIEATSIEERMRLMLIYLLSQSNQPNFDDWLNAVEDLFSEFGRDEQMRFIEIGRTILQKSMQRRGQ